MEGWAGKEVGGWGEGAGMGVCVCVSIFVWGAVLNGSWVHGEWIRQRCHLTLRFLSHLKTEDNVHWSFFTGSLRR